MNACQGDIRQQQRAASSWIWQRAGAAVCRDVCFVLELLGTIYGPEEGGILLRLVSRESLSLRLESVSKHTEIVILDSSHTDRRRLLLRLLLPFRELVVALV